MELKAAAANLSALGHEGRLAIFRLLVQAGPPGVAAGELARRLDMIPNTLSR
jgi:ArsR family transcriptional regulator, arsenate/arsenite/antimonite-responsive transcriptional repressor